MTISSSILAKSKLVVYLDNTKIESNNNIDDRLEDKLFD